MYHGLPAAVEATALSDLTTGFPDPAGPGTAATLAVPLGMGVAEKLTIGVSEANFISSAAKVAWSEGPMSAALTAGMGAEPPGGTELSAVRGCTPLVGNVTGADELTGLGVVPDAGGTAGSGSVSVPGSGAGNDGDSSAGAGSVTDSWIGEDVTPGSGALGSSSARAATAGGTKAKANTNDAMTRFRVRRILLTKRPHGLSNQKDIPDHF